MLVIWTKTIPGKVLKILSPVLKSVPDLSVAVVDDYSVPQGTTAILALGSEALKKLQAEKLIAKNRTTTSYRTLPQMMGNVPVLVSYSPDIGDIDHGYYVDLLTDVSLAIRYCLTGKWVPIYGTYQYVQDFSGLCISIEAEHTVTQNPVDVSMDLETLGLDPYAEPSIIPPYPGAYIVSMQATNKKNKADVIRFADRQHECNQLQDPAFREQVEFLLRCPYIRLKGANFKYDLHWLWRRGGFTCSTFTFDTTIVGSLLDENRCVSPDTRLLMGDLSWVKATNLHVGDELLGFDEYCSQDPGKGRFNKRALRSSVVQEISPLVKRCYRLTMKSGRSLTVSDNHQFLRDDPQGTCVWCATEQLQIGDTLRVFSFAEEDRSYDAGWMSGFLEGEGWVTRAHLKGKHYFKMGVAQRKNSALVRAQDLMVQWGLDFFVSLQNSYQKKDGVAAECWTLGLKSGSEFALLQRTRPQRLLEGKRWLDTPVPTMRDIVVQKELVGKQEVLAISTTTHTFIAEGICSHNSNGLDIHVKIYVPELAGYSDRFDRTVDKARMDKVPPDQLLPYAGGDVDGDLQVAEVMKRELLSDPQLTSFYVNILHPAARAFEQVEQGGIVVDKDAYQELKSDLEQEHARLVKDACKIMGGRIVVKHGDPSKPGGMNLTKASMLTDFMFSPMGLRLKPKMFTEKPDKDGIQRPSTALEHLEMFADVPEAKEFIEIIRQDSAVVKTLQTYVVGFLEHLRSDGRYHPSYWLFVGNKDEGEGGAKTGRLSCTAPAFQCMVGNTVVTTEIGQCRLDWLVDHGHGLRVLTHTGRWQAITHTYRNGVQPVFRVKLSTGQAMDCTANHPVLTTRGWIRTDYLQIGDVGYVLSAWPHRKESQSQPNVHVMDGDEKAMHQPPVGRVAQVRGQGHRALLTLDAVPQFFGRYGREAGEGVVDRAEGQQGPLRTGELCVGNSEAASQQQEQQSFGNAQRSYPHVGRVGEAGRDHSRVSCLPFEQGDDFGSSLNESEAVQRQVFSESTIVSIEALGERETFDLTIENSHSFIANGVVVHNTVPKHTKWAKRIRRCFPAPSGYVVVERDYGQGELRVIACIAHEQNMINVFKSGKDIHADTAAPFAGFTYEALMALEKTDLHTFEETRQLGKAGNFGLVFGMKEDGFVAYAKGNYGVDLTWDQAHDFREGFFKKYPNLLVYHEQYKRIAREQKQVRTPLGRIRHLPLIKSPNREVAAKAERQAINSPVQGCLTDMVLWTIALEHKSGLSAIAPCFGACHDSILNYVPEDKVDEIVTKQLDQMESLPFELVGWKPQLKFVADAKVGFNWGEVKKFVRT